MTDDELAQLSRYCEARQQQRQAARTANLVFAALLALAIFQAIL